MQPSLQSPFSAPHQIESTDHLRPGDEAIAGSPGTAENICRLCGGTGIDQGQACIECEGSGHVTTAIGGA